MAQKYYKTNSLFLRKYKDLLKAQNIVTGSKYPFKTQEEYQTRLIKGRD